MNKTLLLIIFFFYIHNLSAQEITVTPNPSLFEEENVNLDAPGIQNIAYLNVQGISTAEFAWIKIIESAPEEWDFAVTDSNLSHFPETDIAPLPMVLSAGQESPLVVELRTNGVAGCGTLRLDIALWDDDGNHEAIYSAYYEFKVNNPGECLSSINEINTNNLNIYPNPTSDYFTVKTPFNYSGIQLFNTTGQLIKSFSKAEKYSVVDLPKALYFVQIFNQNERIGTQKIIIEE